MKLHSYTQEDGAVGTLWGQGDQSSWVRMCPAHAALSTVCCPGSVGD